MHEQQTRTQQSLQAPGMNLLQPELVNRDASPDARAANARQQATESSARFQEESAAYVKEHGEAVTLNEEDKSVKTENEPNSKEKKGDKSSELLFRAGTSTLRNVTITVTANVVGTQPMFAYPEPILESDGSYRLYNMPVYEIIVSGTDATGKSVTKTFKGTRYGVGNNPKGAYGYSKQPLGVYGLNDSQTIYPTWGEYDLHSDDPANPADIGGLKLTSEGHWIHDGPDSTSDAYGSYGCIEMCGKEGLTALKNYIVSISGSTKSGSDAMNEMAGAKKIAVIIQTAKKPTIDSITP